MELFRKQKLQISTFGNSVFELFRTHPVLAAPGGAVHSVKWRLKSEKGLREKLGRKSKPGEEITHANFFGRITDLYGVRVLHLYQHQFSEIHEAIEEQLRTKFWVLAEQPKAYTWDPEAKHFFEQHGLNTTVKESWYTSIHYLVKPREDSPLCCEVQVRTLFEEIWGEVDHALNYPEKTGSLACREQLSVLARLVGAGSRLGDAIFRSHREFKGREADAAVPREKEQTLTPAAREPIRRAASTALEPKAQAPAASEAARKVVPSEAAPASKPAKKRSR